VLGAAGETEIDCASAPSLVHGRRDAPATYKHDRMSIW